MASILNTPHWVYVIGNMDFGWVKIGFTGDVPKRFNTLQVGVPFKLQRLASWKVANIGEAVRLERLAHDRVEKHRIRGEWYGMTIAQIVDLAEYLTAGRTA